MLLQRVDALRGKFFLVGVVQVRCRVVQPGLFHALTVEIRIHIILFLFQMVDAILFLAGQRLSVFFVVCSFACVLEKRVVINFILFFLLLFEVQIVFITFNLFDFFRINDNVLKKAPRNELK